MDVKLIFRLKIVSKHWLSVISDPYFVGKYISRVSVSPSSLQSWHIASHVTCYNHSERLKRLQHESIGNTYSGELECPSYLPLQPPGFMHPQREKMRIYGINNGFVLCVQTVPNGDARLEPTDIYKICNPVTGQWIPLLPPTCQFENDHWGFLTRVEQGVLQSYRVVYADLSLQTTNARRFHVFLFESGEWKDFIISNDLEIEYIDRTRPPTDLHGNLHWALTNGILAYDPYQKPSDLRIISLPRDKYNQPRLNGITSLCGVSDGKLRYFELCSLDPAHGILSFEFWILHDYNSGDWSLQSRINQFDIRSEVVLPGREMFTIPVAFDPFDSDIVHVGGVNVSISYNVKTKRSEARGHPLSIEELIEHNPLFKVSRLPWWMGILFLIPPWPTSIPPCFRPFEK